MPTGTKPATSDPNTQFVLDFVLETCKPLEAIHELAPGVLAITGRHGLVHVYFDRARWEPTWGTGHIQVTPEGAVGIVRIPDGCTPLAHAKGSLRPCNLWHDQPKKLDL